MSGPSQDLIDAYHAYRAARNRSDDDPGDLAAWMVMHDAEKRYNALRGALDEGGRESWDAWQIARAAEILSAIERAMGKQP